MNILEEKIGYHFLFQQLLMRNLIEYIGNINYSFKVKTDREGLSFIVFDAVNIKSKGILPLGCFFPVNPLAVCKIRNSNRS